MTNDNRRDDHRVHGGFRVNVLHRQRVIAQGTSLDVSAGGLGLQTAQQLPVGMIYELRMSVGTSGSDEVCIHGRVENSRPGYVGFGVDPSCRRRLEHVIDDWSHREEQLAEAGTRSEQSKAAA